MRGAWEMAVFGSVRPGRRLADLAGLGMVAGIGEALVVVLIVALVSGDEFASSPFSDQLPDGTTGLAVGALIVIGVLAAARFAVALRRRCGRRSTRCDAIASSW